MSDENEKLTDSQLAEEETLEAQDTATATDDEEQEIEDASSEQTEVDEPEVDEVEEPAVIKSPPKKEPEEELDPIKRALLPKKPDTGPVVMDWYILKVQSNRERSIAEALQRKIAIEGLDRYFGEVVVPTEKVTEFKGGKKKVVERKLYPGYIVVHMCINDDTWFAVRETAGIGDFTGSAGKPSPMLPHEVARIITKDEEEVEESPKLNINFKIGDRVKIKDGTFESFEGDVNTIDEQNGRINVMINIFGRSTPVELEYWQVENI
ncbi:transcription termination/antitermination protein NusG [Bythopirellula polymerisocia]|uniref:transcription termination/antitermination protein NusG n=1 Tax=Bythopirellula polymerisocia TaxID=2528003 RepID=UPI001E54F928|nr:transcription termination/antitermination protein NusG [Bythopirellula polymerisocia]